MTGLNLPGHRRSCRTGLVILGVVVGGALLSGCASTPDRPSPAVPTESATPVPTPSTTAAAIHGAPTNAADAVSAAQDVVADFFTQRIVVNTAGGADLAPLSRLRPVPLFGS